MGSPLEAALLQLDDVFGPQQGLLPSLPGDAVMARLKAEVAADNGSEARRSCCRLLVLMVSGELDEHEVAIEGLMVAGWVGWPHTERTAVLAVFDAWWGTLLAIHPFEPGVDRALVVLSRLDVPLVRWLKPMLEAMDGPGANHVAEIILDRLADPGWNERPEIREEILSWCRTDPVVMGLTVVGGVHLPAGLLGSLLDELL